MKTSIFARFKSYLTRAERWYLETPDRALDQAYDSALKIKAIEDEHFNSKKIAPNSTNMSPNVFAFFEADLKKYLKTVRLGLSEFKLSRSTLNVTNPALSDRPLRMSETPEVASSRLVPMARDKPAIMIEKLRFIDEVLARYHTENLLTVSSTSLVPIQDNNNGAVSINLDEIDAVSYAPNSDRIADFETVSDKTGLLPRSILGTLNRLKRDLDPKSEQEVVQTFRSSKVKTVLALRFILTLILVPLLVQQVSRNILLSNNFAFGAAISRQFKAEEQGSIFINSEMAEEALGELKRYEELLNFENLVSETLGRAPIVGEEIEARVKEKAGEIADTFAYQSGDAIKNWISDILAAIALTIVLLKSKREIAIFKSFIDEIVYGLSDSAKAFIIILFTDIFVGFHSPHGWEVLLEGIARHFGLPASHNFIFLFIATFPVILDTIFKYWIFRYLNRISPSAVATYKTMNE
ncbi:proton extrusion protein PcxA [Phormidesmis priestleyi ULC007]|uniref:Proton extrusion protein PxcA n=1 Tax=Phormidesmis priestleyi ULC007 TaxID=1920490 RepID=A0A2T1D7M2_9CYAN|nr:proton extrusion protein PcxA [Phormidesmis priestleyi]PSB16434.1 proton extrusion protein PcxA [Phormidesmis priestleyi ULC007]PZO47332.1 MAG: proton extrusion protein PcxA [Phormidesmis priestleyi]